MRPAVKKDIRSKIEQMSSSYTSLFLIELEHGKFFAGESVDPWKTMEEHREGIAGVTWTQIHRPVLLREIVSVAEKDELTGYVREAMIQYGMDNVRGGPWSDIRLTDKDRQQLSNIRQPSRGCVVC